MRGYRIIYLSRIARGQFKWGRRRVCVCVVPCGRQLTTNDERDGSGDDEDNYAVYFMQSANSISTICRKCEMPP